MSSKGQCRNILLLLVVIVSDGTDSSSSSSTDSSHSGITPPGGQDFEAESVPLSSLDTEKLTEKLTAIEEKSVCCSIECACAASTSLP